MQLPYWLLFGSACAGPISTWWYDGLSAPQVAMYDSASGNIFYSFCNSDTTPIFPANETAAFALDSKYPPLNGTSVAGIGYQTSDAIDIVSWFICLLWLSVFGSYTLSLYDVLTMISRLSSSTKQNQVQSFSLNGNVTPHQVFILPTRHHQSSAGTFRQDW